MGAFTSRLFDTFNIFGLDPTSAQFTLPGSSSTSATEQATQAQENAMLNQAAAQAATQKQTAEMEAKSKADAEALKLSSIQADEQARKDELKKRARVTKTLLTGPQGVLATAETGKKTLLGE